jgi:hypothetical protein
MKERRMEEESKERKDGKMEGESRRWNNMSSSCPYVPR